MRDYLKAAVLEKFKKKLKVYKVSFPDLMEGQVLVQIYFSGLCGSQIFEINGDRSNKDYLPHMLGHEATGKVIKIGKNVKRLKIGDRVFVSWIKSQGIDACNAIYTSRDKKEIKINSGKITTLSNYSVISENRIFKLPKNITYKTGVLLGCALPTGSGMIKNEIKINKNKILAIIGMGGVGLSSLLASLYLKAKHIDVFDKNKKRMYFIKKKIKYKNINFYNSAVIKNRKFNDFYDYVIESSGVVSNIERSIKMIKKNGKVIFATHPKKYSKIKLDPFDLISGKKIQGSWGGGTVFKRDIKFMNKIINCFKNIDSIYFTRSYSLKEINLAISDMRRGIVIRPLIKMF